MKPDSMEDDPTEDMSNVNKSVETIFLRKAS